MREILKDLLKGIVLIGISYLILSLLNFDFDTRNWGGFSIFFLRSVGFLTILIIYDNRNQW